MICRSIPSLFLLLFTLGGCGGDRTGTPDGAEANQGAPASDPQAAPTRIVSLVPSATGILVALGREGLLVGRTDYDDGPSLSHLPSVGGGLGPSIESLVALRPDLVIRFEGESDPATTEQLDRAGIPHLGVRPDGIEDIRGIISTLGALTGGVAAADSLVRRMDARLDEVRRLVDGAPRPRALLLLGGDPPWAAGGETFLHELLEIAGGENVFADLGSLYAPVSLEEVARREVEVIVASEGTRIPGALSELRVIRVSPRMQIPGHDVGMWARELAHRLHPERVP